jgi:hypothetical protein
MPSRTSSGASLTHEGNDVDTEEYHDLHLQSLSEYLTQVDLASDPVPAPSNNDDLLTDVAFGSLGNDDTEDNPAEGQNAMAATNDLLVPSLAAGAPPKFQLGFKSLFPANDPDMFVDVDNLDISLLRIYSHLREQGYPLYAYDELMTVLREECLSRKFNPADHRIPSRETLVSRLQKQFGAPQPTTTFISLESHFDQKSVDDMPQYDNVAVIHFPFVDQLQDLLLDSTLFGDINNLVVDPHDPYSKYHPYPGCLDEVHDGTFYSDIQIPQGEEDKCIVVPIMIYVDKTGGDVNQRFGSEPFVFTTSLLRRKIRNNPEAWRHLGFLPELYSKSSAEKTVSSGSMKKKGVSARNYHKCLDVILASFQKAQQDPPSLFVRAGDEVKYVKVLTPICLVSADGLCADTLVCRKKSYSKETARMCPSCLVSSSECSNPNHKCSYVRQETIELLTRTAIGMEELEPDLWKNHIDYTLTNRTQVYKFRVLENRRRRIASHLLDVKLGTHRVMNAFFGMDFGPSPHGIFGALRADIMHAFEAGMIAKVLAITFDPIPPTLLSRIDRFMDLILHKKRLRSAERESYPRVNFTRGFTRITLLTCNERVGSLLGLAILLATKQGAEMLSVRFSPNYGYAFHSSSTSEETESFVEVDENETIEEMDDQQTEATSATSNSSDESVNNHDEGCDDPYEGFGHQILMVTNTLIPILGLQQIAADFERLPTDYSHELYRLVWKESIHIRKAIRKNEKTRKPIPVFPSPIMLPPTVSPSRQFDIPAQAEATFTDGLLADRPVVPQQQLPGKITLPQPSEENGKARILCDMTKFRAIIENMLAFHTFFKQSENNMGSLGQKPDGRPDLSIIQKGVAGLINDITENLERDGCNWNLQKTHVLFHLCREMEIFGCESNSNTGTGESGLKTWALNPMKTAQKRDNETHTRQTAERVAEMRSLSRAKRFIRGYPSPMKVPGEPINGIQGKPRYLVEVREIGRKRTATSTRITSTGRKHGIPTPIHPSILDWFAKEFCKSFPNYLSEEDGSVLIKLHTEWGKDGERFRSDPDYHSDGPWFEWSMVEFEVGNTFEEFPAKLLAFFEVGNATHVLAHCCDFRTRRIKSEESMLMQPWRMEVNRANNRLVRPKYTVLNTQSINERAFVVQEVPGLFEWRKETDESATRVVRVKARNMWPVEFIAHARTCLEKEA